MYYGHLRAEIPFQAEIFSLETLFWPELLACKSGPKFLAYNHTVQYPRSVKTPQNTLLQC